MSKRVAITDMEILTPYGDLKSTVNSINTYNYYNFEKNRIGSVPFYVHKEMHDEDRKVTRDMTFPTYLAYHVAKKIKKRNEFLFKNSIIGVCIGQTLNITDSYNKISDNNFLNTDIFKTLNNSSALNIAGALGLTGIPITSSSACSTSLQNLILGYSLIKSGVISTILCGGSDVISTEMLSVFNKLGLLSPTFIKSFSKDRDGTSLSEGASMFLLENYKQAKARGAKIYGEIIGVANSNSCNIGVADSSEILDTMIKASKNRYIDIIDTHGTGTVAGDEEEAKAINAYYSKHTVCAWKKYLGHMLAAGGLAELALSMQPNIVIDSDDMIGNNTILRRYKIKYTINPPYYILKNSFGLGGSISSILVKVKQDETNCRYN